MAYIYKRKRTPSVRKEGSKRGAKPVSYESWVVEMCRTVKIGNKKKKQLFRSTFGSKKEAEEFAEKWEPVYMKKGKKAVEYDSLHERRKRRFGEKYLSI